MLRDKNEEHYKHPERMERNRKKVDIRGTVVRRGGIITGWDISMGFNIEMIRCPCLSMRARIGGSSRT